MAYEIRVKHQGKYKRLIEEPAPAENPINLLSTLTKDQLDAPSGRASPRFAEFIYTGAAAPSVTVKTESGYACAFKWDGAKTGKAGTGQAGGSISASSSFWGAMSAPYNASTPKYFAIRACDASGALDKSEITYLSATGQNIAGIQVGGLKSLQTLNVSGNKLARLDVSGLAGLTSLYCGGNNLRELDLSALPGLSSIHCDDNELETLNLERIERITDFGASGNRLRSIAIPKLVLTGYWIMLRDNLLESVDIQSVEIGPELQNASEMILDFSNNQLSASAINKIFGVLPDVPVQEDFYRDIQVYNNPGAADCDKAIAKEKGWAVYPV
jgi:Leucine-rich repeat (LRR) protein